MTSICAPSASTVRTVSTSDSPFETDERRRGDVDDVGRQVLGRDLERDAGPGRGLVEEDRDLPAAQRRDLGDRPGEDLAHRVGRAHDELDVGRATGRRRRAGGDAASATGWLVRAPRRPTGRRRSPAASAAVRRAVDPPRLTRPARRRLGRPARSRRRPRRRSPRGGPDELLARGRHVLADVVGPDRQLAMAAIDEDGEADRLRPAEVDEGVHRGPDRPAGVQDVVDEDDRRARRCPNGRSVPLTTGCWATSDRSSR